MNTVHLDLLRPNRNLMRVGVRALTSLMLLGVLLGVVVGGFHHHVTSRADDGCAVCTLAHTSADTPAIVTVPTVTGSLERLFVALLIAPGFESRAGVASRAPPLG